MAELKPRRVARTKIPTQTSDQCLQQKLDKITELQKGINILRDRMNTSKKDLMSYFEHNPQLKNGKYLANDFSIRYIDRKVTDGISQKLITSGLAQYFKMKQIPDAQIAKETALVLQVIKNQRQTKITPNIDIRTLSGHSCE